MSEWKIKGVVDDTTQKSAQEQEQAVLDKAVEAGDITPEAAGQTVDEVPKINLDELNKTTEDAVQKRKTEEVSVENETGDSEEVVEEVREQTETEENSPLELVVEEEDEAPVNAKPSVDANSAKVNEQPEPPAQTVLPENIDKLVKFMEETGGSLEDYVKMNKDVSELKDGDVLREYYSQSKPWDSTDIEEYMEDQFSFDEDDDPREIRSKKRAFKEELYNARKFFETNKEKYYADLKLSRKQEIPEEYQKAYETYNEYKKEQKSNEKLTQVFLEKTDKVFSDSFKGFDFQVGDSKFRYKVNNKSEIKETQSNIANIIKPYLNEAGEISDAKGYHKAMFAAQNADKLAQHFYEQGRADAIRQNAREAKNINMDPRQTGEIKTSSGQKFKVVSGDSSSKLKIKLKN